LGRGARRWAKVEPETPGNKTKPDKEREEDKFTPMGGGGGDDDGEGVEKTAFHGSGSSHQLAAVESESNNRLSRDS
jgi:hypothetical protein